MSEKVRLERIRICRLFDRFSYNLDFRNGNDISILIAPNGCGKTTIFNIVNFIWNPSLSTLKLIENVPFHFCECALSNGKSVVLARPSNYLLTSIPDGDVSIKVDIHPRDEAPITNGQDMEEYDLVRKFISNKQVMKKFKTYIISKFSDNDKYSPLVLYVIPSQEIQTASDKSLMSLLFSKEFPGCKDTDGDCDSYQLSLNVVKAPSDEEVKRLREEEGSQKSPHTEAKKKDRDALNITDLYYDPVLHYCKFDDSIENDFLRYKETIYNYLSNGNLNKKKLSQLERYENTNKSIINFLDERECNISINFIQANRLTQRVSAVQERDEIFDSMYDIQQQSKNIYTETLSKYNRLQQEIKDKLPQMYIESSDEISIEYEQFAKRWMAYVSSLDKFRRIGLLPSNPIFLDSLVNEKLHDAFKHDGKFLTVYLDAFERTLPPLEECYKPLSLFLEIINNRNKITKKICEFNEEGFSIKINEKKIPFECLSSGEKNDFIMFYNLIFNSTGIVLIDEPEISLHIEWQEEYLDYLLQICELNHLQAIVATHSPNIINGHFELYAEKEMRDEDDTETQK